MSDSPPLRTSADAIDSGFAGSLTAIALRRIGYSVVLLERGRHPRFAIGESSTPLANLLEERCDRYDLDRVRPFCKWGTWRRHHYPAIGCGLKRGFSFVHDRLGEPFRDDERHRHQLVVAASPHDDIGDTHWYRPDVDAFLAAEAARSGVAYLDEVSLTAKRRVGLSDRGRRDRYPVRADDLIAAAPKLGATPEAVRRLLPRRGLTGSAVAQSGI